MAQVIAIGREMDPVVDSVTGAPVGVSVGINQATFTTVNAAGALPASTTTVFGSGVGVVKADGLLNVQTSSTGISPGATAADNVLAFYSIPANSFDVAGREVTVQAAGSFGATGNTKTIKIIFNPATAVVGSTVGAGGTTIASTGAVATNGGGWQVEASVTKYGAAASNTQLSASTGNGTLAPALTTGVESGPILVAITGNAATTASDIVFNLLTVIGSD